MQVQRLGAAAILFFVLGFTAGTAESLKGYAAFVVLGVYSWKWLDNAIEQIRKERGK